MTLEKLEARHQKELKEFYADRDKRLIDLEMSQCELIGLCEGTGAKAHKMLENLLQDQWRAFEAMEQEEFDMLKMLQYHERESFLELQTKRDELAALLSKGKDKDRGR